ncbi:hypothetical protein F442_19475 [Phytophthora nicotianae P10297]|uniref:Uncharacterized protein n=1 Tax=Phytophthora nicotianae P10297 TaxID=1317064 RepID=W2YAD3_PHYNI|nr:hypothetical protein F442_19475 [Phytophthora nicotianae P10297]
MNTLTTVEEFREFILTGHPIVDAESTNADTYTSVDRPGRSVGTRRRLGGNLETSQQE